MFAYQISSDAFVRVRGDWSISQALSVLEKEICSHVIGGGKRLFLVNRQVFLGWLSDLGPGTTLAEAFAKAPWEPTPRVDAHGDARDVPDRAIIINNGVPMGFYDLETPPPEGLQRSGTSAMTEATPRALSLSFPREVRVGETHSLLVSLVKAWRERETLPHDLENGAGLDLVVQPRCGFDVLEPGEGTLTITDEDETLPIQFKLKAIDTGLGKVRVFAFYRGRTVAVAHLSLYIRQETESSRGRRKEHEQLLRVAHVPKPDLTVLILEQSQPEPCYSLLLSGEKPEWGLNFRKYGPISLARGASYFDDAFHRIEAFAWHRESCWPEILQHLRRLGKDLFSWLFPAELGRDLGRLQDQIGSIQILSEEPAIPWELCKYHFTEAGRSHEGPFFCERQVMTRWAPGIPHRMTFTLNHVGLVFPHGGGQVYPQREEKFLKIFADPCGGDPRQGDPRQGDPRQGDPRQGDPRRGGPRRIVSIPSNFHQVRAAMASGVHDGWHFGGHAVWRNAPHSACELTFDDHRRLSPGDLTGSLAKVGRTHPLVFLNCCHSGRQERDFHGVSGWPQRFMEVGASGFIGAFWSVTDQPAYLFAKAFYGQVFGGKTVGEAARYARSALRRAGNPSWLAYTVYAHPFAKLAEPQGP